MRTFFVLMLVLLCLPGVLFCTWGLSAEAQPAVDTPSADNPSAYGQPPPADAATGPVGSLLPGPKSAATGVPANAPMPSDAAATPLRAVPVLVTIPEARLKQVLERPSAADTAELHNIDRGLEQQALRELDALTNAKNDVARAAARRELTKTLDQQFRIRQGLREKELADLETRTQKLRELLKKREAAKDAIIGDRIEQLLRVAEGLGWDVGGARSSAEPPMTVYKTIGTPWAVGSPLPALSPSLPTTAQPAPPERRPRLPGDAANPDVAIQPAEVSPLDLDPGSVEMAKLRVDEVQQHLAHMKNQYERGTLPVAELEAAQAALAAAEANLAWAERKHQTQQRLLMLALQQAQLELEHADRQLAFAEKHEGTSERDLSEKSYARDVARNRVEQAQALLDLFQQRAKAQPDKPRDDEPANK